MSRLDAALAYAARGWAVLPLRGKLPRISKAAGGRGVYDATTDTETIKEWWTKWPDANIGIACGEASGFWCLDVDVKHQGDITLENFEDESGALPETVRQETGSGGQHILFRHNGQAVGNRVSFAPGLDTRSSGGYIVVAPSLHPDTGRPYAWDVDHHPDDMAVADAPAWLLEKLEKPSASKELHLQRTPGAAPNDPFLAYAQAVAGPEDDPQAALQQACDAIASAPCSEQETTLNTRALCMGRFITSGELRLQGVADALAAAGRKMANQDGREPWTAKQIEAKVMRALSDGMASAGEPEPDATRGVGAEGLAKPAVALPPSITDYPAARWDGQEAAPPEFVIDDLAPRGRLVNVAGVGGAGKGILMQTAATCIAAGLPFLNKDTLQGPVAYYSCEDEDSVLHHRQARINALLGLETTPAGLFVKSYLGFNLTMFNGNKWTRLFEWLWDDIDKLEGCIAAVIDPASEVFLGDFLNPVAVKSFCRRFDVEAVRRDMAVFMTMHTAKGGDTAKTPFGSAQWLYATRATLMLETVVGEDGKQDTGEAVLRVAKGNFVKPGEEIPLIWTEDGLLVQKDEPDAYEVLANTRALEALILELCEDAWRCGSPLSDSPQARDRYLPAKIRQHTKGKFSRRDVIAATEQLLLNGKLRLGRTGNRHGLRVVKDSSS